MHAHVFLRDTQEVAPVNGHSVPLRRFLLRHALEHEQRHDKKDIAPFHADDAKMLHTISLHAPNFHDFRI